MTLDLEQIKRDREAGTDGPWVAEHEAGPANPYGRADTGVWAVPLYEAALADDDLEPDDEKWVCGIWGKLKKRHFANARLIAAAPEMADALIEATEKIARLERNIALLEEGVTAAYMAGRYDEREEREATND